MPHECLKISALQGNSGWILNMFEIFRVAHNAPITRWVTPKFLTIYMSNSQVTWVTRISNSAVTQALSDQAITYNYNDFLYKSWNYWQCSLSHNFINICTDKTLSKNIKWPDFDSVINKSWFLQNVLISRVHNFPHTMHYTWIDYISGKLRSYSVIDVLTLANDKLGTI